MSEQNVAPQGTMQMSMTAPALSNAKEKRKDIQLLPAGPQVGIIYAVVGLGTHMESYQNQAPQANSKIYIAVEFPQLKQLFYVEDTVPRSTTLSLGFFTDGIAYAMTSKAKLRALCEAVIGRPFKNDQEAYSYDVSGILGAKILFNIETKESTKTPGTFFNNIRGFMPLGGMPIPPNFNPELNKLLFAVDQSGNNFRTQNYADLPYHLKKKIMESEEAKRYIATGGVFAKNPDSTTGQTQPQQQQQQTQTPPPSAPAPQQQAVPVFKLLDTQFTLDAWKHAGWTEQALVDAGKAIWETPAPVQAPAAPTPQTPPPANYQQVQQPASAPTPMAQQAEQQAPKGAQFQEWLGAEDDLPF